MSFLLLFFFFPYTRLSRIEARRACLSIGARLKRQDAFKKKKKKEEREREKRKRGKETRKRLLADKNVKGAAGASG